jgi:exopolyphosphatase/guanosine-5'-triphosphate,3'-diphosphate pyrophosphatase
MHELVAVVDLGSTAVRFLLARVTPESGYRVIAQERVPTRLGGGTPGTLPRAAIDDTLRAVRRFFRRHADRGRGPRIVAVATSAVRDARDRERLLAPLRYEEGIEVQVLSAHDEARLGAEAALGSLPIRDALVADLGGASLQLSRVRAGRVVATDSLPLGAVRTTRRFLRHDPPRPRELRALRREIREQLLAVLRPAEPGEIVVGLGGTIRTLASIHLNAHPGERRRRHGLRLRQSDVTAIRERLESIPLRKRRTIRGLRAERADITLAGAIVVEELMVFGGYLSLAVCDRGVRDGILLHETFNGRPRSRDGPQRVRQPRPVVWREARRQRVGRRL